MHNFTVYEVMPRLSKVVNLALFLSNVAILPSYKWHMKVVVTYSREYRSTKVFIFSRKRLEVGRWVLNAPSDNRASSKLLTCILN